MKKKYDSYKPKASSDKTNKAAVMPSKNKKKLAGHGLLEMILLFKETC